MTDPYKEAFDAIDDALEMATSGTSQRVVSMLLKGKIKELSIPKTFVREGWPGYCCVLGDVRYSPIFDSREEAENYPHRPKGTEVIAVRSVPQALLESDVSGKEKGV